LLRISARKITLLAASTIAITGLALGPGAGIGLAATQAPAAAAGVARPDIPNPGSPFIFCTNNPNRVFPCVAETQKSPAFFYPSDGSASENIGVGTEVEVSCYYTGTPVDHKDATEDHVVGISPSGVGFSPVSGHVPDYHVSLGGASPAGVGIPHC
jgi:hypothetical protein